jgi:hypothetical protein
LTAPSGQPFFAGLGEFRSTRRPTYAYRADASVGRVLAEESDYRVMATVDGPSPVSKFRAAGALYARNFLRRLVASEAELDAEELQREAVQLGCACAHDVKRGETVSVSGRLRTVVYTPRTNLPTLEADLYDGTDVVTLVWLGRRQIAGIEPGRQLTARGRIAVRDDRKVIYNPYYELEPAHGEVR